MIKGLVLLFIDKSDPRFSKYFWLISIFLFLHLNGNCQPLNLFFEHLNHKQGLTNRFNDFIKKDSRGYIWISSLDGVYRYDGMAIQHFTPSNTKKEGINDIGLLGKDIQSDFFENRQGDIYFTPKNGINCYQRSTGLFLQIKLVEEGDTIKDGYSLFHLERDSILWLKAGGNIYSYNVNSTKLENRGPTKGFRFTVDTLNTGKIKTIYACPWVMGPGIEYFTFPSGSTGLKQVFLQRGIPPFQDKPLQISKVIIEHDSLSWLLSNIGIISFNPNNPESTYCIPLPPEAEETMIKDGVILNDSFLITTTKNAGFWLFDRKKKKFIHNYQKSADQPGSISGNDYREIYLDNHNLLWLCNYDEAVIDYSWLYRNQFGNPFLSNAHPPKVLSVVEDNEEQVWCATQYQGLFIFDLNGKILQKYPYQEQNSQRGLAPIKYLNVDRSGSVWGISKQRIYRRVNNVWKEVYHNPEEEFLTLLHLSGVKKLVASSQGLFLYKFDTKTNQLTKAEKIGDNEDYQVFYAISSSKNQAHFCANRGSELILFKFKNGTISKDTTLDFNADIYAIKEIEEDNSLALATSNGAFTLDLTTLKLKNIFSPKEKELQNTQVYFLTKDWKNRYWLSTNSGIWSYFPEKDELRQYSPEDGLSSRNVTLYAHLQASDGKIWLGVHNGAIFFHPDNLRPYPHKPQIQINSLTVNQDLFDNGQNVSELKALTFQHNQNNLKFEVIGITHYLASFNRIFYKLQNYHTDWLSIANGEDIILTNIPSGEHLLEIYGKNANGLNGETRKLKIIILPPWWKRPGVIISGLLLFGFGAYQFYQYNLKRKLKRQKLEFERKEALRKARERVVLERKEALREERDRIASEMHDDLGAGLTSIQFMANQIQNLKTTDKLPKEHLKKLVNQAEELKENMGDIIWALNSEYDQLPGMVAYLRRYFVQYLSDNLLECNTCISKGLPDLLVKGETKKNIFLCMKEATHNIVKHANASEVNLSINWDSILTIKIQDNGSGINGSLENSVGNGMKNMRNRMEKIGGTFNLSQNNGTCIKLTIPIYKENVSPN